LAEADAETSHGRAGIGLRFSRLAKCLAYSQMLKMIIVKGLAKAQGFGRLVRYSQMPKLVVKGLAKAQRFGCESYKVIKAYDSSYGSRNATARGLRP
jgi:hypothetical protein